MQPAVRMRRLRISGRAHRTRASLIQVPGSKRRFARTGIEMVARCACCQSLYLYSIYSYTHRTCTQVMCTVCVLSSPLTSHAPDSTCERDKPPERDRHELSSRFCFRVLDKLSAAGFWGRASGGSDVTCSRSLGRFVLYIVLYIVLYYIVPFVRFISQPHPSVLRLYVRCVRLDSQFIPCGSKHVSAAANVPFGRGGLPRANGYCQL